jgi:hypothetical protein
VQEPIKERIKRLRDEAELNKINRVYLKGSKYGSAIADHERRLERLQAILDELKSLSDWNKP